MILRWMWNGVQVGGTGQIGNVYPVMWEVVAHATGVREGVRSWAWRHESLISNTCCQCKGGDWSSEELMVR